MKITNKYGLPEALVAAVTRDDYDFDMAQKSDITVTGLLSPPLQRRLWKEHADEIEEDVSERIWMLLGSAIHYILESAEPSAITEKRLFAVVDGYVVSGKLDRLHLTEKTLQDYKVTSAWSYVNNAVEDWTKQLNMYKWLADKNGIEVNRLEIVAIFRDWSQSRAQAGGNYPPRNAMAIPVETWPSSVTEEIVKKLLSDHFAEQPRYCTDEERWASPEQWALMREGRKSAIRLMPSYKEIFKYAEEKGLVQNGELKKGHSIVQRPRKYARCEGYCPVAQWCPQWQEERKE